jgi:hypothetical protein
LYALKSDRRAPHIPRGDSGTTRHTKDLDAAALLDYVGCRT